MTSRGGRPQGASSDDTTPYDGLWTWLAITTMGFALLTLLRLSTGGPTLVPTGDEPLQDDVKAAVAYWGLLSCTAGLAAMGFVAMRFARSGFARPGLTWPRLKFIEEDRRVPLIAGIGLLAAFVIPLIGVLASLSAYVDKSEIALWDAGAPLADGFIESRIEALTRPCDIDPCRYRMAPKLDDPPDAHQWFFWSDLLPLAALFFGLIAWSRFVLAARMFGRIPET